jgi:hypothetical protein
MIQEVYQKRISHFNHELKRLRKKDIQFSVGRFGLILISGLCFYLYLDDTQKNYYILFAILGLIFFTRALVVHLSIRKKIKKTRNSIQLNENEIAYLNGDLSEFRPGNEFVNSDHLYAHDLDVFGEHSLFQHINRTITRGGKRRLANSLNGETQLDIIERQHAIKELSTKLEWRQSFTVSGMDVEESENIAQSLKYWLSVKNSNSWLSPLLLYPLAAIGFILLGNWMYTGTLESFNWFSYAFFLNLALVAKQFKVIKKEYEMLSGISKSVLIYGELLEWIEKENFESSLLQRYKEDLKQEGGKAGKALQKLSRILNGFDQLNNVVALMLTNGLYHYHLHTLRNLFDWKKKFGPELFTWLEVISSFDELSSLGNYAYNHPDYVLPKVSSTPTFTANELGHPLLNTTKRVDNSISFSDFRFMILTGSNMAGKSTFLKTLGLNLVLAKVGAPVCARSMEVYPFRLLTSMKLVDSISKEESYFQAEVLRLKRIHSILQTQEPCFVLLDEILRGTNSDDKRSGTRLFLKKIQSYNTTGVIATHDVDISDLAFSDDVFKAGYFESKVIEGELYFDYILRDGVCKTPNATDLMKAQGII